VACGFALLTRQAAPNVLRHGQTIGQTVYETVSPYDFWHFYRRRRKPAPELSAPRANQL